MHISRPAVLVLTSIGVNPRRVPFNHPDYRPSDSACRSEEHTSELQSLMRNSYAVFCLKKKTIKLSISQSKISLLPYDEKYYHTIPLKSTLSKLSTTINTI